MTRFPFPLGRILWSLTALLMLHWNALASDGGQVRSDAGSGAGLQATEPAEPFILTEIGPPIAAEERQSGVGEPPSAEDQAIAPSRFDVDFRSLRLAANAVAFTPWPSRSGRAFNARGPPRSA
jgi:hypothetical protein